MLKQRIAAAADGEEDCEKVDGKRRRCVLMLIEGVGVFGALSGDFR
jgi:hypothetical protein